MTTYRSFAKDLFFLFVFNTVYLCTLLTKEPIKESLVHPWLYIQYFLNYKFEFIKRGLIGSFFQFFGIEPNQNTIIIFSIVVANLFFILFYLMAKKAFRKQNDTHFFLFISLFLLSAATAMQFAYDIGRFDYINLLLLMSIIILLTLSFKQYYIILIALLLFLMLINHEAILFIGIPLVMTISYHEVQKHNYPPQLLYVEVTIIIISLLLLFLFGKADNTTLASVNLVIHQTFPTLYTVDALSVWQNSFADNIAITLSQYQYVWKSFFVALPLVGLYIYLFSSLLEWSHMSFSQKLIFLSPFGILPMFILGHDFFRWLSMLIIIFFISFIYLLREKQSPLQYNKKELFAIIIIFLYTFMGPLGVMDAFPKNCLSNI